MIFLCIGTAVYVALFVHFVYVGDEVLHTVEVLCEEYMWMWKRSKKMYISTKKILFCI